MRLEPALADIARRIRPLRDRVAIKPIEYRHSVLFVSGIELRKGIVVAVGPGRRIRRLIPWRLPTNAEYVPGQSVNPGQTFYVEDGAETGKVKTMSVQVGDVVEYGFRDVFLFEFEGASLLMIKQNNIYGTTDARTDSGFMEPNSAPVD